ncbi:MAG: LytTR family transcriptional regulator DNA-binding domain-containing protein [Eubacteriales bacterium]|nr:LytTR family transcriptional regulator DNA-binding domain-containing protein [Eubacteriales bacterium]
MKETIKLLINRKWETIPTKNILYITISDKLSFLHLRDNITLNLFITLSELEQELPRSEFVRVSRNCIVNYHSITSVHDSHISLCNGESLPYSKRREKSILDGYQKFLQQKYFLNVPDTIRQPIDFAEQYKGFDSIPFAFAVIEMVTDHNGECVDFIFRYANEAMAHLEDVPLEKLTGHSFLSIFKNIQKKWLAVYQEVAFEGKHLEIVDFRAEINKTLRVLCFQPFHGFCACLITDVTGKPDDKNSSFICPRKFTDTDTCQRFLPLLNGLSSQQLDTLEQFLASIS